MYWRRNEIRMLRQIIDLTVESTGSVADAVRRAKVLSMRLGSEPLKHWVDSELSGYQSNENLPHYRRYQVEPRGNFVGGFGREFRNTPIPPMVFDENFHEYLTIVHLQSGIGFYEQELRKLPRDAQLREMLPNDLVAVYSRRVYENMTMVEAWKSVDYGMFENLVDQVRNGLLSFALELEQLAPDLEQEEPETLEVPPPATITQIFTTTILGETANIAIGSSNLSQSVEITINPGDLESLIAYLRSNGVADGDLQELMDALNKEPAIEQGAGWGPRVQTWIGGMVGKAQTGSWTIGTGAAANLLADAIGKYYGIG